MRNSLKAIDSNTVRAWPMALFARHHIWVLMTTVLGVALVGQLISQFADSTAHDASDTREVESFDLTWQFHPSTFREARNQASLVVQAQVVAVERGPDMVSNYAEEQPRIPTQRITVEILKVYRGQSVAGQTLTLFQTGGIADDYAIPRFSNDDPSYEKGDRYVLLLEPAIEEDLLRIVSPEGRYRIDRETVVPMVENSVTSELRNKPLQYLEQLITAP